MYDYNTRMYLNDMLNSLMIVDEMLDSQIVSLEYLNNMIITGKHSPDFKYKDVNVSAAILLNIYIDKVKKSNPHDYIPLVREYIVELMNS